VLSRPSALKKADKASYNGPKSALQAGIFTPAPKELKNLI